MGLYDTIRLPHHPLPGHPPAATVFQTKRLGCQLDVYHVDPQGRLMRKESNNPDHPHSWIRYTGQLRIYTADKHQLWWEYQLHFQQGTLTQIDTLHIGDPCP